MGIMSPMAGLDGLTSIRTKYRVGFSNLVRTAINTINKDDILPLALGPNLHQRAQVFLQQRYVQLLLFIKERV